MSGVLSLFALSLLLYSVSAVNHNESDTQDCSPPLVYELGTSACLDFKYMNQKVERFEDAKALCPAGFNLVSVQNVMKMEFLYNQFILRDGGPSTPSHFWTSAERSNLDQEFYWHYGTNETLQVKNYKPFQQPPTSVQNYIAVSMLEHPKTFIGIEDKENNFDLGIICEKIVCPPPPCSNSKCQIVNTDAGCPLCQCASGCTGKLIEDKDGEVCYTCDCQEDRICWVTEDVKSEPLLTSTGEVLLCDPLSSCPAPGRCQASSNTCCVDTDVVCPPQLPCDYRCTYERRHNDVCPKCYCSEFLFPVIFNITISNGLAVDNGTLTDLCSAIEFSTQSTNCKAIPNSCTVFYGKLFSPNAYNAKVLFQIMTTTPNIKDSVMKQCKYVIPNVVARDMSAELGTVKVSVLFDNYFEPTRSRINTTPCLQPRQKMPCEKGISFSVRYEYSSTDGTCNPFPYDGCETDHINAFRNKSQCEKKCETDRCYLPIQPGACKALLPRWAYNIDTGRCQEFTYGGCMGNANNFFTESECMRVCEPVKCQMPLDEGSTACYALQSSERWYHIKNDYVHECQKKTYTGCLGNTNRFLTKNDCESSCMKELLSTESQSTTTVTTKLTSLDIKETKTSNTDDTNLGSTKEPMTTERNVHPGTQDKDETENMSDFTRRSTVRTTRRNGGEIPEIPELIPGEALVLDETDEPEIQTNEHDVTDSGEETTTVVNTNPTGRLTTVKPRQTTTENVVTDFNEEDTKNPTPRIITDVHDDISKSTTEGRGDTSRKVTDDGTGTPDDERKTRMTFTIQGDDDGTKSVSEDDETPMTSDKPVTRSTTRSSGYPIMGEQAELYKKNGNYCTCRLCGDPLLESFDGYRSAVEGGGIYVLSRNDYNHSHHFALLAEVVQSDPVNFPSVLTIGRVLLVFRDIELLVGVNRIAIWRNMNITSITPPYQDSDVHIEGHTGGAVWILTADNISLSLDFSDSDNVEVTLSVPRRFITKDRMDGFCRDCDGNPGNDCVLYPRNQEPEGPPVTHVNIVTPQFPGTDGSDRTRDSGTETMEFGWTRELGMKTEDSVSESIGMGTESPVSEVTDRGVKNPEDVCNDPDRFIKMSKYYRHYQP